MSNNQTLSEDCRVLGIDAESGLVEVNRAYRNLKSLFAEQSPAIYGLLGDDERQEKLEGIEEAYRRIVDRLSRSSAVTPGSGVGVDEESLPKLDAAESPGRFLRQLRERAGLSLREIAHRTKVSPMKLEQIEQEKFERLPAAVYLRGFVLEFARALGYPRPQEVAELYLSRCREHIGNP